MTASQADTTHFLNSVLKSPTDIALWNVNRLLEEKRTKQADLNRNFEELKQSTRVSLQDLLEKATTQKTQLDELHDDLTHTQSEYQTFNDDLTNDTDNITQNGSLLSTLQTTEKKLCAVERAQHVVKALLVATDLSEQANTLAEKDAGKALLPYTQLVKFSLHVAHQSKTHSVLSPIAHHLDNCCQTLYNTLRETLSNKFNMSLNDLSWPTPLKQPYSSQIRPKLQEFENNVLHLLKLQSPQYIAASEAGEKCTPSLTPIHMMVDALTLRFRFHFESSKPTNRLDKPEWYLTHVKNTIATHLPFLITTVQPIVDSQFTGVSVKDYFIETLLENVTRKLRHSMPKLLNRPQWLSHTIHEVLLFDKALASEFAYGSTEQDKVGGVASVILEEREWFETWFASEKKFAQTRYDEIVLDKDAFELYGQDEGASSDGTLKRTKSSVQLVNLLESVTETYKLLPSIIQKTKFLVDIQFHLLEQYQQRITAALDSFEAVSLVRTVPVPGALPDAVTGVILTSNTGGTINSLRKLYRWWASCTVVCDELADWSDDDFFLDLEDQLRQHSDAVKAFTKNQKFLEERFPINLDLADGEAPDGILFPAVKDGFKQLSQRAKRLIVRIIMKEWAANARMYARRWQLPSEQIESLDEISPELYQPLQDLRLLCNFLAKELPRDAFEGLCRELLVELEEWHMRNIIAPNRLTSEALSQLKADLEHGLWNLSKRWINNPANYMRRLGQQVAVKAMD